MSLYFQENGQIMILMLVLYNKFTKYKSKEKHNK